jgi:antitoxin YefM
MTTIYRLNADELDERFLDSVKGAFAHRQIEIAIHESDETARLLGSPANRRRLLEAVADIEAGKNLVTPDQSDFQ